ncbi:hypothetical protein NIES593_18530 [Hydrococcus rivularis NIES-593]|uniref:Uncharacterized protein n=1 Tax=Hydrococcus rivularis NIES-593 TaxID=1921803 RepID=A0A1U7HAA5_9CYAN|nr:hypothetical protein [Hydrococcus rivularis]OKH20510.1 hypothetical protein NIES593_18530 [Hydrococcus rivularis NIES-593]
MGQTAIEGLRERVTYPGLPLAIYREVAAHLRQVLGIKATLIAQDCQQFDYNQSQIGALQVEYPTNLSDRDRQQVEAILAYYARVYSPYQRQPI